ncbi:hypothetical protein ACJX0J_018308, partial [Zea mays]
YIGQLLIFLPHVFFLPHFTIVIVMFFFDCICESSHEQLHTPNDVVYHIDGQAYQEETLLINDKWNHNFIIFLNYIMIMMNFKAAVPRTQWVDILHIVQNIQNNVVLGNICHFFLFLCHIYNTIKCYRYLKSCLLI